MELNKNFEFDKGILFHFPASWIALLIMVVLSIHPTLIYVIFYEITFLNSILFFSVWLLVIVYLVIANIYFYVLVRDYYLFKFTKSSRLSKGN